ncbi:MAG: polysaccharide deacetylase family protein [Flavitalea sp.]
MYRFPGIFFLILSGSLFAHSQDKTYAEKLGWPKNAKVIIFHVDDAGMSYSSNQGAIQSIEKGIATSCSIMMPTPWAASFAKYVIAHPAIDAGLHLTLTSEWDNYRWGPLCGKKQVPGLTDTEGALWPEVEDVVAHASAEEVECEIKAQLDRALTIGLKPTHLDSHMGTLFANEAYLKKYIQLGIDNKIPVMFPGGNNKMLTAPSIEKLKATGKWKEGMALPAPFDNDKARAVGKMIWDAGLPVLDDLHTNSGDWKPANAEQKSPEWTRFKVQQFIASLKTMQPGLAMIIVHSSDITDTFRQISASGGSRYADMMSMMDPELKAYIKKEGIILTTWREVMERRQKVK